ncbi:Gfo/Idh/MocA family oxidoreductase [Paraburkholderia sediminicola]|uniref:Gfo/Idh/MocA family protein n=1 Tax=Paraburkholderia TaxID=1822464 RepID=UPI0038BD2F6A
MTDFPSLRIGILGAANIAGSFARAVADSKVISVSAVASRDLAKAKKFAADFGIRRAYGTYEDLLDDREVDAVYIPLPNHLHSEWTIRAAKAGKHVLCEKPIALNAADAGRMFDAGRTHNVLVAEAYPYMSQPQTLAMCRLLADGAIGRVQSVTATLSVPFCTPGGVPLYDPGDIRFDASKGGGALGDLGTYAMSVIRLAVGERPSNVHAVALATPSGVDQSVYATLIFPNGVFAQLSCSFSGAFMRRVIVVGESGVIESDYSNHGSADGTLNLLIKRGAARDIPFETVTVPAGNGFLAEAESFVRAIGLGWHHWNGATKVESIDTAASLESILASVKSGLWVEVQNAQRC